MLLLAICNPYRTIPPKKGVLFVRSDEAKPIVGLRGASSETDLTLGGVI